MGTKLSPPEKTGSRPTPPQLIGWRRLPPFEKISISSALRCEENPIFSAVSRPRDITFQFLKRVISPPSLFSEYKCVDHEWPWDFTEIARNRADPGLVRSPSGTAILLQSPGTRSFPQLVALPSLLHHFFSEYKFLLLKVS
jgi:hypothetical protein